MTAGIIVAIMIIPIITSITREVFATVPDADKQAAFALGATRWEMIKGAVLPAQLRRHGRRDHARPGPGDGRDDRGGPDIGAATQITPNLFATGDALPAVIVRTSAIRRSTARPSADRAGVLLFVITIRGQLRRAVVVRRAEIR